MVWGLCYFLTNFLFIIFMRFQRKVFKTVSVFFALKEKHRLKELKMHGTWWSQSDNPPVFKQAIDIFNKRRFFKMVGKPDRYN